MLACKACICSIYGYSLRGIYPLYSLQGILRKQLRQTFFTVDIVSLSLRLSLSLLLLLPLLLLTSLSLLLFSVGLPVSAVHSLSLSLAVVRRAALRHALSVCVCVCVCLQGIEMRVQLLLLLFLLHCCTSCTSSLDRKMFCSQNVQRQTNFHCCRRQFCCDDACIKYVHVSQNPQTHTHTHTRNKQTQNVCPLRAFI